MVSIINYSALENKSRIEPEYYQPKYLVIEDKLKKLNALKIINYTSKITDGTHFTPQYVKTGVKFYSALNVKENIFEWEDKFKYISQKEHQLLYRRCSPEPEDILIRKVGVGPRWSCVIQNNIKEEFSIFVSLALLKIRKDKISPYYLSTFINSFYGQSQLLRIQKGMSQPDLHLEDIAELKVPRFLPRQEKDIENMVIKGLELNDLSQSLYTEAQELLEHELGLGNSSLNSFSNIFGTSFHELMDIRRLDSEYYNPKVKSIVKKISENKNSNVKSNFSIKNGFPWYSKKFLDNNSGEPVVRIRDIKPTYIDNEELTSIDPSYCNTINFAKSQTGDITVGMDGLKYFYASIIEEPCYINQRVCHLTPKSDSVISPEYLTFIINSNVGQSQLLRDMTIATTVGHITNQNIANLLIPIVSDEFHDNITNLVRKSIDAKKDSKILLEQAKCRVEELIEQAVEK